MRVIVLVLLTLVPPDAVADEPTGWTEHALIYLTVASHSDSAIIAEADAALASLGFHRDSVGTTYPGNLVPGIFASYKAGGLAAAMIVEASRTGCLVFSATNYDHGAAGLVEKAQAAVQARFRKSFGKDVAFFSDAKCTIAL
jgi:hypothetical protein